MRARAFAQLAEGEIARWKHEIREEDVGAFAALSGDVNPFHLDNDFARKQGFRGRTVALEATITNQRQERLMTGKAKMMMAQSASVPWTEMVALVTGASRGIGAAVARALGQRGARVVVNYHRRQEAADEVVSAITAAGGQATAVQADVADEGATIRLAESALEAYGRVDAVVNNATPPIERKPLEELSWAEVERYWRAYVQSAFCSRSACCRE